mmetsp:Transcript_17902/g.40356  ORF Transcript_17902/g.40356 Transcript_17902/m.40356 type:complete len:257 (+) Transcript_17902:38-808(+)
MGGKKRAWPCARRASAASATEPQVSEAEERPQRRRLRFRLSSEESAAAQSPQSATPRPVQLFVFWGYAGWSRCQLMGEIARGSWGLCRAADEDVIHRRPSEVWQMVYPRLMFAPPSEMSESYNGQAPEEEARRRELRRMAIFADLLRRQPLWRAGSRARNIAARLGLPVAAAPEAAEAAGAEAVEGAASGDESAAEGDQEEGEEEEEPGPEVDFEDVVDDDIAVSENDEALIDQDDDDESEGETVAASPSTSSSTE